MSGIRGTLSGLSQLASSYSRKGKSWVPTAGAWGGSAALIGLFLTDWKVIMAYIPFIKDKYEHKPPR